MHSFSASSLERYLNKKMGTTNPDTIAYENIFKKLIWDRAVDAALVSIFASVPWLNIWPIAPIVKALLNAFGNAIYGGVTLFVDMQEIRLSNLAHQKAYEDVSIKLSVLAHDRGITSVEFIKARDNAKKTLSIFTRFIG